MNKSAHFSGDTQSLVESSQITNTWTVYWARSSELPRKNCVGNLTIIGSYNGLSPGRRQAIIWTNAGIFLIETLGTNFSKISIEILAFSFKEMSLKFSSAKWQPFCLGLNVLTKKLRNVMGQFLWQRETKAEPSAYHDVIIKWGYRTSYPLTHTRSFIVLCFCAVPVSICRNTHWVR